MRISLPAIIAVVVVSSLLSVSLLRLSGSRASAAETGSEPPKAEIAVCAILEISEELMNSDRFRPAREVEEERLLASLGDLRSEISELSGVLRDAARDDPGFADERQKIQQLLGEYQQKQGIAQQELERFIVAQFAEAYELSRSSARAIAEQRGFRYLFASSSPDKDVPTDRPMDAVRNDMFQRPVLMSPEESDISDDVRADLNLL